MPCLSLYNIEGTAHDATRKTEDSMPCGFISWFGSKAIRLVDNALLSVVAVWAGHALAVGLNAGKWA